jgi:Fe-S-cluster containining protein
MKTVCDDCGLCCRKLVIEIDHIDIVREPRVAEVATLMDGRGRIKYESDWEKKYLLAAGVCPLLDSDSKCSVYSSRPNCCVWFEAGGNHCNELRADAGLPPIETKPPIGIAKETS